jgi:hypothetical protein
MTRLRKRSRTLRAAAVGVAAASTLLLGACGNDTAGPETGADVGDVQQEPGVADPGVEEPGAGVDPGAFDADFSDVNSYVGKQVTVSADVNDVISPTAFTIAGTENTAVDELLVLHRAGAPNVTEDSAVTVTGTVRQGFSIADAEAFVGTDLNDNLFTDWNGEHYIEASKIDLTVPEPGETAPTPMDAAPAEGDDDRGDDGGRPPAGGVDAGAGGTAG